MKLKYIFPVFIALLSTAFVSCDDDDPTYLDEIRVSQSMISIPEEGGTVTIEVTTTDSWSIDEESIPSWVTIAPTSGSAGTTQVSFTAEAYSGGREETLTISCAGRTQYLNLIQGESDIEEATCAEVIAGPDSKTYRVTGTCTAISNTTYGNWYLTDETGTIYIYGTLDASGKSQNFTSLGIEVGDVVTVEGPKTTYNGTVELVDVTVVSIVKSLISVTEVDPAEVPLEGGDVTVSLECKGDGVNVEIPEDAKDWLSIVSITSGTTPVVIFHAAENTGGERSTELTFKTYSDGTEYTATTTITQKGSIQEVSIADFLAAEVGDAQYRITGIVTNVANATNGNFTIRDYSGEVYVYRASGFSGKEGDIVTLVGKRAAYNGSPQMSSGTVEELTVVNTIAIADIPSAADDNSVFYMVTGKVTEIANSTYGNMYLADDAGNSIYVYGVYPGYGATGDNRKGAVSTYGIEVGKTLTVIAYKTTYNGTAQLSNGWFYSIAD